MKRSELKEGMEVHVQGHDFGPAKVVSTKPYARGRRQPSYEATVGNGVLVQWPGQYRLQEVAQLGQLQPWGPWKAAHDEEQKAKEAYRAEQMSRRSNVADAEKRAVAAAAAKGLDQTLFSRGNDEWRPKVKVDAGLFEAMLAALPQGFTYEEGQG